MKELIIRWCLYIALGFFLGAGVATTHAQQPQPSNPTSSGDQQKEKKKTKPKKTGGGMTGALQGIVEDMDSTESTPAASPTQAGGTSASSPSGPPGEEASPFSSVESVTDPKTGITTTTGKRPDGSQVITKVDRDGNVISTEIKPPPGGSPTIVSTTDPKTGITTTTTTERDGAKTVTKTETREDPDGTKHIVTSDDKGSRSETIIKPDGTMTTSRTAADGETVSATKEPDGTITMVENHAGGGETITTRDKDGQIVTEKRDAKGNKIETVTKLADGSQTRTDEQGNVTKTSAPDAQGKVTETATDHRGNTTTIARDAKGEVIAREEQPGTPKEPGQQYYENVIGGTGDWESLPGSMKTRFAGSEREMRDAEAMQKLRASQNEYMAREDEARKKSYAENKAKMDEKLAAIDAEQKTAEKKSAERIAREKRQNDLEASYDKAAKLQEQYDAAVNRGDTAAARRIMKEQDKHHDASNSLLALNDEEKQAMERKQAVRDEMVKLFASAREEARRKDEHDAAQSLKEGITDVTKWGLTGSEMQQSTKESTRQANRQISEAESIRNGAEKILKNPKSSQIQRDIAANFLKLCDAKERGAYEQLSSNANLTTAGYAIDAASLIAGGPATKLASKVLGTAGERAVSQIGLAATRRIAGKEAAQALGNRAAALADKARAAAKYVGDSKVGTVLSTDAGKLVRGQIAQAESKYLKDFAADCAKGAAINAGAQVALTGNIDPESVIKGAIGGAILNSTVSGLGRATSNAVKAFAGPDVAPPPNRQNIPDQPVAPPPSEIAAQPKPQEPPIEVAAPKPPQSQKPPPEVAAQPQPQKPPTEVAAQPQPQKPPPEVAAPKPPQSQKPPPEVAAQPRPQKPPVSDPAKSGDANSSHPPDVDNTGMGRFGARSKTNDGPAPESGQDVPRRYDPEAPTDHGVSAKNSGATPERIRNTLKTPEAQKRFDRTMDVVDKLIKEDPALAKLDRNGVARRASLYAPDGNITPEAIATAAVNYDAPPDAHVTGEKLSRAAGLSGADADAAVQKGWDRIGGKPGSDDASTQTSKAPQVDRDAPTQREPGDDTATNSARANPKTSSKPPEPEQFDPSDGESISQSVKDYEASEAARTAGEEILQKVGKTTNTEAEKFAEKHPWRDPDDPKITLADANCFSNSVAVDQRLAGVPPELAQSIPSVGMEKVDGIDFLQSRYNTDMQHLKATGPDGKVLTRDVQVKGPDGQITTKQKDRWLSGPVARDKIVDAIQNVGDGARGIIGVTFKPKWSPTQKRYVTDGHAINVVNHNGQVVFVDGQSGKIVSPSFWNKASEVSWIRTDKPR